MKEQLGCVATIRSAQTIRDKSKNNLIINFKNKKMISLMFRVQRTLPAIVSTAKSLLPTPAITKAFEKLTVVDDLSSQ